MIEIVLGGCALSLAFGLAIEKSRSAELRKKNAKLKKALLKQEQDNTAARDAIMSSIGELQFQIFFKDEEIDRLRVLLARKENLIRQKWNDAKGERK